MSKTTFTVFAEADLSNVAFTVADGLPRAESSALITSSARANFVWSNQSPTESLTPLSLRALRISGSVIVLILDSSVLNSANNGSFPNDKHYNCRVGLVRPVFDL